MDDREGVGASGRAVAALARAAAVWVWAHPVRSYLAVAFLSFLIVVSQPVPCNRWDVESGNCPNRFKQMMRGYNAGVFWPLYWSWEIAELLRGGEDTIRAQGIEAANAPNPEETSRG